MVKVKVHRAHGAAAGASGLLAGLAVVSQGAAGCAVAPASAEVTGEAAQAATTPTGAGEATLKLSGVYGQPTVLYQFFVQGGPDEFVRTGERLTVDIDGSYLWYGLHPSDGAAYPDLEGFEQLAVTIHVQYLKGAYVVGRDEVKVASWTGTQGYDAVAHSAPFVVPDGVDTLEFGITIADPRDGASAELADRDFAPIPVFGGEAPLKHALFDNDGSTFRQRIIEGGSLVQNAQVALTYTDWRADTVVDKSSIDKTIGTARSYSRFGAIEVPILGDIQYEISYGYAEADANGALNGFYGEVPLTASTSSRVLGAFGRTAYESSVYLASYATKLALYFHVKAYLVVDYSRYGSNVLSKKYTQGQRILVREKWDNANGKAGANYELPVVAP